MKVEGIPRFRPTISIYQNPEHVAGILQQLHFAPLVQDESRELGSTSSRDKRSERAGQAELHADAQIPAVGKVGGSVSGDRASTFDDGLKADSKLVQRFTYSQAYYLSEVRDALWRRSQLKKVDNAGDASTLEIGDFVEFQASFRPNELHSILDILTPELVGEIVDHNERKRWIDLAPEFEEFEKYKIYYDKMETLTKAKVEVARAAVDAVKVDFRAGKTREFYGCVGDVTAITICDSTHFVVEDEDRVLDGSFSVLGKVTSSVENDLPVLNRNKLLDRLSPELIDSMFEMLRDSATKEAVKLERGRGQKQEINNAIDLALPSRIEGPSFKVVPIAIYI